MAQTLFGTLLLPALISAFAANAIDADDEHITIEVQPIRDKIAFCIRADSDRKISAQYGVEFKTKKEDHRLWSEVFPKVVSGDERYFAQPLRLDLKTNANVGGRIVQIEFGACSAVEVTCSLIQRQVKIPVYDSAHVVDGGTCG